MTAKAIKKENILGLNEWLAIAKNIMRLQDWRITFSDAPSSQDTWAEIDVHSQRNEATIYLGWDFFKQTPDEQRATLSHELVHVILSRTDQIVEGLEAPLGTIAYAMLNAAYEDGIERASDQLGRIIAQLLPPLKAAIGEE
jgi:hypothetical protein